MSDKINKEDAEVFDDERDLLLDHNYDGIRELDNHMPRWWLLGFWLSIFIAIGYMMFYHVLGLGQNQIEEYEEEMANAVTVKKVEPSNAADWVNLTYLTDSESIGKGKGLYNSICNVCHGGNGEGLVGPNLTDEYWMHGCDLTSVMTSIKVGFASKGMPAYGGGKALDTDELHNLASYIHSLKGSKPANAKPIDAAREVVCE